MVQRSRCLVLYITIFWFQFSFGQLVDLKGQIVAAGEVDGIHVINTSASRFTISDSSGKFTIPAKLNDTILFSGISYQPKEIVITKLMAASQNLTVYLEELVTVLDEVVVGKILTGDLIFDLKNTPIKPEVNFYNLGIPGYTGKPKTQSERRLYEATSGGGFIPLNPILNAISGRTKELKNQVSLEGLDNCLYKIKSQFSEILFGKSNLAESLRIEFFYYCQDDLRFERVCKVNNDLETFEFLEAKLESYKDILRSQKN